MSSMLRRRTRPLPALLAAVGLSVLGACGSDADEASTTVGPSVAASAAGCPAADGSSAKPTAFTSPPMCLEDGATYAAVVTTNHGAFTIALDSAGSPVTVNNFVTLARLHYYDGTGCHRVMAAFVVQCGRPGEDERAPGYTIADELPAPGEYAEGVVAMANTGQPNSGGGQWFVITGPNGAALPPAYSIVGTVTEGYDTTVKALEALADPAAPNGVPTLSPIEITSVEIVQS
jgi:cyclophilin family peptidyl-prolyl cis-trans isomerase